MIRFWQKVKRALGTVLPALDDVYADDERPLLAKALGRIDEKQAFVLISLFFEDMTLGDVGKYLRVSHERIRQLRFQGLRAMHWQLKYLGVTESDFGMPYGEPTFPEDVAVVFCRYNETTPVPYIIVERGRIKYGSGPARRFERADVVYLRRTCKCVLIEGHWYRLKVGLELCERAAQADYVRELHEQYQQGRWA